jgi:hypothetical protein
MAHAFAAWQLATTRDVRRVAAARPIVAGALRLPANERERMHLAALSAVLDDDFEGAKARLGRLLDRWPRDAVALGVAHSLDHVTGDVARMRRRVARALPAWSRNDPGYHALLAMHAFALAESGAYARAEEAAHAALELHPLDARACHAMAHVFEMTDRYAAGVRWMSEHAGAWATRSTVVTHGWWHVALFHLSAHESERALALYDTHVRGERSGEVSDLIDASALLWRIALAGRNPGARWASWRTPGRPTSTMPSAASATSTRCSRSSAQATGIVRAGWRRSCRVVSRSPPATARRRGSSGCRPVAR